MFGGGHTQADRHPCFSVADWRTPLSLGDEGSCKSVGGTPQSPQHKTPQHPDMQVGTGSTQPHGCVSAAGPPPSPHTARQPATHPCSYPYRPPPPTPRGCAPEDLHAWLCVGVEGWLEAQLLHAQSAEELTQGGNQVAQREAPVTDDALNLAAYRGCVRDEWGVCGGGWRGRGTDALLSMLAG